MSLLQELASKLFTGGKPEEAREDAQAESATKDVPEEHTSTVVVDDDPVQARIVITYRTGIRPDVNIEGFHRLSTTRLNYLPQLIWREVSRMRSAAVQAQRIEEAKLKEVQNA